MLVISLDRRPDRWESFRERAAAARVDPARITRLSAVDASTFDVMSHPSVGVLTEHNLKYRSRRSHYEIDRPGAIGASLSHFKAWEYLQSAPPSTPALIVFEDDSDIPVDFNERLATVVEDLPDEWDVVTFYNTPIGPNKWGCVAEEEGGNQRNQRKWLTCTEQTGAHAYMISRRGARRLLARAYPIEIHVDAYIAFMSQLGHIRMVAHPDMQVSQVGDDSDIQHGGSGILRVPTDMDARGLMTLDMPSVMSVALMAFVVGGFMSLALFRRR